MSLELKRPLEPSEENDGRVAKKPRLDGPVNATVSEAAPPAPAPAIPRELSASPLPEPAALIPGVGPGTEEAILLSQWDRSQRITVLPDGLTAQGEKGYRMIRATHGVTEGEWYFEVKILPPHDIRTTWTKVGAGKISHLLNDIQAHTRIGWSAGKGELQAPVGYDRYSFAYRDVSGTKFHQSTGKPYGDAYGPGDVIGCHIWLPPIHRKEKAPSSGSGAAGETVEYAAYVPVQMPLVGSRISFYKNGVSQGVAFTDMPRDTYYPAASLYMGATCQFNFGPVWWCPPADLAQKARIPGKLWSFPPKLRKRQQKGAAAAGAPLALGLGGLPQ